MLKMSKQAVKQIVQVLVHAQAPKKDEAILQPGRKKRKTTRRATKKPAAKKPSTKPPLPPPSQKPRAPDGFISQVFGAPRPPPQFIPAQYTNLYDRIQQIEKDSQLAKAIQRIEKLESKETPTPTTPVLTRADTAPLPPARPATGVSIGLPAETVRQISIPPRTISQPSVPLRQLTGQQIASGIMERARSQVLSSSGAERVAASQPQSAPNRANQPSVDVDGDGKEEEHLQPQQPSFRLAKSSSGVSPYQLPAQPVNSSSSVFGETPDQEWTPEFAQAARAAGVSVLTVEEQPRAGEMVDIVTGIRVPPPQPPAPPRRRKVYENEEDMEEDMDEEELSPEQLAAVALARENERLRRAKAVQPSKRSQRKKANE